MHWTEFILQLLDRLLWPLLILSLLIYWRSPIAALLPSLKKLKYQSLELEFDRELQTASQNAQTLFKRDDSLQGRLLETLHQNPNQAVLDAWKEVETAASDLIQQSHGKLKRDNQQPYKQLEDILIHEQLVTEDVGKLFTEVRLLRNKVSHAPDFHLRPAEAVQYIELCDQLIQHLKHL